MTNHENKKSSGCDARAKILLLVRRRNFFNFLRRLFLQERFEVCTADEPSRLTELVSSDKCTLAVVDVAGLDPEDIASIAHTAPNLPVLVIIDGSDRSRMLKFMQAGAADFIEKPFDISDFMFVVRDVIGRQVDAGPARGLNVRSSLKGWVELTAASNYEYVARFRQFMTVLPEAKLGADKRDDIMVAIDELGRNAVEWGNRHDPNKRIHLSYCLFDDRIIFKIEDEGDGFDIGELASADTDPLEIINRRLTEGKRTGGFGSGIVERLVDEVTYNEKGNIVFLVKYL